MKIAKQTNVPIAKFIELKETLEKREMSLAALAKETDTLGKIEDLENQIKDLRKSNQDYLTINTSWKTYNTPKKINGRWELTIGYPSGKKI